LFFAFIIVRVLQQKTLRVCVCRFLEGRRKKVKKKIEKP
jgi:hypothetical protein